MFAALVKWSRWQLWACAGCGRAPHKSSENMTPTPPSPAQLEDRPPPSEFSDMLRSASGSGRAPRFEKQMAFSIWSSQIGNLKIMFEVWKMYKKMVSNN